MTRVLAALAALLAFPAAAQENCAMRDHVVERLASAYGEGRQAVGLAANNQFVEVYANLETGTWTITVTTPNGLMCLVASGQAFERMYEAPAMGNPT